MSMWHRWQTGRPCSFSSLAPILLCDPSTWNRIFQVMTDKDVAIKQSMARVYSDVCVEGGAVVVVLPSVKNKPRCVRGMMRYVIPTWEQIRTTYLSSCHIWHSIGIMFTCSVVCVCVCIILFVYLYFFFKHFEVTFDGGIKRSIYNIKLNYKHWLTNWHISMQTHPGSSLTDSLSDMKTKERPQFP